MDGCAPLEYTRTNPFTPTSTDRDRRDRVCDHDLWLMGNIGRHQRSRAGNIRGLGNQWVAPYASFATRTSSDVWGPRFWINAMGPLAHLSVRGLFHCSTAILLALRIRDFRVWRDAAEQAAEVFLSPDAAVLRGPAADTHQFQFSERSHNDG